MFINRVEEIHDTIEFIQSENIHGAGMMILNSFSASGITYFLEYIVSELRNDNNLVSIYVNGEFDLVNNLYGHFFSQLSVHYPEKTKFVNSIIDSSKRFHSVNLMSAALEGIPFAGPLIREFIDQNSEHLEDQKAIPSPYGDHFGITEILTKCIMALNQYKVVIIIDKFENLDKSSLSFIKNTSGEKFKNLYYIISHNQKNYNEDSITYDLLPDKHPFLTLFSRKIVPFYRPQPQFVLELAQGLYNKKITYLQAESIVFKTQGNIYQVLDQINKSVYKNDQPDLSSIQNEIILLLLLAKQPLKRYDIKIILFKSKDIYVESLDSIDIEIANLIDRKILNIYNHFYDTELVALSSFYAKSKISIADELRISDKLYSHFRRLLESNGNVGIETLLLLFNLAKKIKPDDVQLISMKLVKLSLSNSENDLIEKILKEFENSSIASYDDFLVFLAFLFNNKEYQKIYLLLNDVKFENWLNSKEVRFISAIVNNRLRNHTISEKIIFDLLSLNLILEEKVSLLIYLISGRLHQNKVKSAKRIFTTEESKLLNAKNYGYFLRNGASTLTSVNAIPKLKLALKYFESSDDLFGLGTCYNNLAVNYFKTGNIDKAGVYLNKSFNILSDFRVSHLSLLLNNLGIYYNHIGKYDESLKYLSQAKNSTSSTMPRIFISINKAHTFHNMGKTAQAINLMQSISKEVDSHEVDRVRQKYYTNFAVLAAINQSDDLKEIKEKAMEFPLRERPKETFKKMEKLKKNTELGNAISDFEPCFLVYWYHNPFVYFKSDSV